MKFTLSKTDLFKALNLIANVVEKKATMPILANVLISAEEGKVFFSGSELDITAQTQVPAKVKERGSTTVNGKMFLEVVRELPEGDVELTLAAGERLEIKAKNSNVTLVGVSAQEYPSLAGLSLTPQDAISSALLLEMIESTLYAVSTDETRFNLGGVCFESLQGSDAASGPKIVRGKKDSKSSTLRLVATDGHRLALITRDVDGLSFTGRVIAPRKGLQELKKVLEENKDTSIRFGITEGFLVVESPTTKLTMRLIDGEFPDYTRALPEKDGTKIIVDSKELSSALRRVALLVSDKQKCVKFDIQKDMLHMSSSSPELGDAFVSLPMEYSGKPFVVGFDSRFIRDISDNIGESKTFVMELNGETGPGKFYIEGDASSFGIVMPMRIV
jgi:DNA polymerase-3 subunit beta